MLHNVIFTPTQELYDANLYQYMDRVTYTTDAAYFEDTTLPPTPPGTLPPPALQDWAIALIVIASMLVIGVIILIIVCRNKNSWVDVTLQIIDYIYFTSSRFIWESKQAL